MKITIEQTQKQDSDIFFAGNVVVSEGDVIMVTGGDTYTENSFCGVILESNIYSAGYHDNAWSKECFKQFHGRIVMDV